MERLLPFESEAGDQLVDEARRHRWGGRASWELLKGGSNVGRGASSRPPDSYRASTPLPPISDSIFSHQPSGLARFKNRAPGRLKKGHPGRPSFKRRGAASGPAPRPMSLRHRPVERGVPSGIAPAPIRDTVGVDDVDLLASDAVERGRATAPLLAAPTMPLPVRPRPHTSPNPHPRRRPAAGLPCVRSAPFSSTHSAD